MHTARRLTLVVALLSPLSPASARAEPQSATNVASLEDRLNAGLRTRLPDEKAFIGRVVAAVRAGRLPTKLVDSTYLWAVERRTEYPFPAFQKALRMQAAKLGVRL